MTAEELLNKLEKIISNERVIKNIDYEMRLKQLEIDKLEDEKKVLERKRDNIILENNAIKKTIGEMPTSKYKEMLKRYYIDGQTWETIAEAMNYSPTQVYKYRPLALKEFKETWEEIQKTE